MRTTVLHDLAQITIETSGSLQGRRRPSEVLIRIGMVGKLDAAALELRLPAFEAEEALRSYAEALNGARAILAEAMEVHFE